MKFIDILRNSEDLDTLYGASDERINEAEKQLNLAFSDEYREYLKAYGLASANGHEFTGICDSPRLDVVSVTKKARSEFSSIPDGFYVVEKAGIDGIMIWQEKTGTIIMTKPHSAPVTIGNSLVEYFEE